MSRGASPALLARSVFLLGILARSLLAQSTTIADLSSPTTGRNESRGGTGGTGAPAALPAHPFFLKQRAEKAYEQCMEQVHLGRAVASCRGPSVPEIFNGEAPGRAPIHFLHIPKTAGRSIELLVGKRMAMTKEERMVVKHLNCSFR